MKTTARYGWTPDLPDIRDHLFTVAAPTALPSSVDLRVHMPEPYDQGPIGSCTGNGIAALLAYQFSIEKKRFSGTPSRLFIYFNEREMENTIASDSGAMIRDGIKSVVNLGICNEKTWPYNVAKFTKRPTKTAYKSALIHRVTSYASVDQSLEDLKTALALGNPIVFGFTVYSSFESQTVAKTGAMPMPQSGEQVLGGHCVVMCGYDDQTGRFLCRNSWGTSWGQQGYFWMPYAYATNPDLASDFWVIKIVS